jgi:hypothetical protein
MRRREFLMVMALLALALISTKANSRRDLKDAPGVEQGLACEVNSEVDSEVASAVDRKTEPEVGPVEVRTLEPSPLISKDRALGTAYFNTLSILSTINGCSLFFGGPAASVDVFKQLIGKVQKEYFTTPVGIQMSGETVNVNNVVTKTEYRLFDKVAINANGPFYRRMFTRTNLPLHPIGTFEPNTREVRVLMFLHELGHVIKGDDGNWLLPNDGKDEGLSRLNSQKIEEVCGTEIKRESKAEVEMISAGKNDHAATKKGKTAPALNKQMAEEVYTVHGLNKY